MEKSTKDNLKIKTPRPYLSWSQLSLWEKSPFEYAKAYIYSDERVATNPFMELGKELAEALEKDEWGNGESPDIELARILLPSYPEREVQLDGIVNGVPIRGKLDGFDRTKLRLGEYKTGRAPWTQTRVDAFGQLSFYALLISQNFGKPPATIHLHWVPSFYDEQGELKLKGEVKTFKTERSTRDLLEISRRITRAWEGIKEMASGELAAIGR